MSFSRRRKFLVVLFLWLAALVGSTALVLITPVPLLPPLKHSQSSSTTIRQPFPMPIGQVLGTKRNLLRFLSDFILVRSNCCFVALCRRTY